MITVVLIHTAKSKEHTDNSVRMLTDQGIDHIVVDGDKVQPLNYNRSLNVGAKQVKTEYALFANNDLIYHPMWAMNLITAMQDNGLRSASPYCQRSSSMHNFPDIVNVAYQRDVKWTGKELVGWALCLRMDLWKQIGGFDERVDFWFSDNIYEWQLKQIGETHAMITNSRVDHIGSASLNQLSGKEYHEATMQQHQKYIEATGHRIRWNGW